GCDHARAATLGRAVRRAVKSCNERGSGPATEKVRLWSRQRLQVEPDCMCANNLLEFLPEETFEKALADLSRRAGPGPAARVRWHLDRRDVGDTWPCWLRALDVICTEARLKAASASEVGLFRHPGAGDQETARPPQHAMAHLHHLLVKVAGICN
ncbi:unnamed protein product, partial [Chrysoparadoxa australica]